MSADTEEEEDEDEEDDDDDDDDDEEEEEEEEEGAKVGGSSSDVSFGSTYEFVTAATALEITERTSLAASSMEVVSSLSNIVPALTTVSSTSLIVVTALELDGLVARSLSPDSPAFQPRASTTITFVGKAEVG